MEERVELYAGLRLGVTLRDIIGSETLAYSIDIWGGYDTLFTVSGLLIMGTLEINRRAREKSEAGLPTKHPGSKPGYHHPQPPETRSSNPPRPEIFAIPLRDENKLPTPGMRCLAFGLIAFPAVMSGLPATPPPAHVTSIDTVGDGWQEKIALYTSNNPVPEIFETIDLLRGDSPYAKMTTIHIPNTTFEVFGVEGFWKGNTTNIVDVTQAVRPILPVGVTDAKIIVEHGQAKIGFIHYNRLTVNEKKEIITTPTAILVVPIAGSSRFIMFDLSPEVLQEKLTAATTDADGNTVLKVDLPQLKFVPSETNLVPAVGKNNKLKVLEGVQLTFNKDGQLTSISWGEDAGLKAKGLPDAVAFHL